MAAEDVNRLDAIPFLACLSADQRRDLEKRCRWRRYRAGQQILDKDSTDRDVYFVVSGAVQIVNYSLTGREVAFAELTQGDSFGELSAIDREPRSASVIASEPGLLASMPASTFISLLNSHSEMTLHLLRHLARIIRNNTERIMDLATVGAVQRVYLEIIRMAEENRPAEADGREWRVPLVPTQKAIAGHASTTRETVARSMSQLMSGGIIERRGKGIIIHDFDRLQRLAGALQVKSDGAMAR